MIVGGCKSGYVKLMCSKQTCQAMNLHQLNIARFSPNGKYIAASTGKDSLVYLYNLIPETGLDSLTLISVGDYHIHPINSIAWTSCGRYLATGGEDCVIVIWRLFSDESLGVNLEPRRVLRGHVAAITSLCFNYRNTFLASGSIDEHVYVWDVVGNTKYKRFFCSSEPIVSVEFSYDGEILITASYEGYVRLWNIHDGMVLRTLYGAPVKGELITSAILCPNSAYILVSYSDGFIRMIDVDNMKTMKRFSHTTEMREIANTREPREMVFIGSKHFLIATSQGVLKYDVANEKSMVRLTHKQAFGVDFNESAKLCISVGPNGLELVDVNT